MFPAPPASEVVAANLSETARSLLADYLRGKFISVSSSNSQTLHPLCAEGAKMTIRAIYDELCAEQNNQTLPTH